MNNILHLVQLITWLQVFHHCSYRIQQLEYLHSSLDQLQQSVNSDIYIPEFLGYVYQQLNHLLDQTITDLNNLFPFFIIHRIAY